MGKDNLHSVVIYSNQTVKVKSLPLKAYKIDPRKIVHKNIGTAYRKDFHHNIIRSFMNCIIWQGVGG